MENQDEDATKIQFDLNSKLIEFNNEQDIIKQISISDSIIDYLESNPDKLQILSLSSDFYKYIQMLPNIYYNNFNMKSRILKLINMIEFSDMQAEAYKLNDIKEKLHENENNEVYMNTNEEKMIYDEEMKVNEYNSDIFDENFEKEKEGKIMELTKYEKFMVNEGEFKDKNLKNVIKNSEKIELTEHENNIVNKGEIYGDIEDKQETIEKISEKKSDEVNEFEIVDYGENEPNIEELEVNIGDHNGEEINFKRVKKTKRVSWSDNLIKVYPIEIDNDYKVNFKHGGYKSFDYKEADVLKVSEDIQWKVPEKIDVENSYYNQESIEIKIQEERELKCIPVYNTNEFGSIFIPTEEKFEEVDKGEPKILPLIDLSKKNSFPNLALSQINLSEEIKINVQTIFDNPNVIDKLVNNSGK